MKRIGKILLRIALTIAILFGVVLWITSPVTNTVTTFLTNIKAGDYQSSYALLAPAVKEELSFEDFRELSQHGYLSQINSWTLASRNRMLGGFGAVAGSGLKAGGVTLNLKFALRKLDGKWMIQHINVEKATPNHKVPAAGQQVVLIKKEVVRFSTALRDRDMDSYRTNWAETSRTSVTTDALTNAFSQYYQNHKVFTDVANRVSTESIESSEITENGLLRILNLVKIQGKNMSLTHEFVKESGQWKLVTFSFKV